MYYTVFVLIEYFNKFGCNTGKVWVHWAWETKSRWSGPIITMVCLKYLQYLQVLSETSDYWLADRECHGYFSMVQYLWVQAAMQEHLPYVMHEHVNKLLVSCNTGGQSCTAKIQEYNSVVAYRGNIQLFNSP